MRPRQVARSGKGLSSIDEHAGEIPAVHAKRQRLVLDRGACERDPNRSREAAKAFPRPWSKRARPWQVTRSGKGLSYNEEQAVETPVGYAKWQRVLLERGASGLDPGRSREVAKACP